MYARSLEVTNAGRRARQNDCACLQGSALGQGGDLLLDPENHVPSMTILDSFSVIKSLDAQFLRIWNFCC